MTRRQRVWATVVLVLSVCAALVAVAVTRLDLSDPPDEVWTAEVGFLDPQPEAEGRVCLTPAGPSVPSKWRCVINKPGDLALLRRPPIVLDWLAAAGIAPRPRYDVHFYRRDGGARTIVDGVPWQRWLRRGGLR